MNLESSDKSEPTCELCAGCGKMWPTSELGAYSLCPNCSNARYDLDERTPRLTGLFGELW